MVDETSGGVVFGAPDEPNGVHLRPARRVQFICPAVPFADLGCRHAQSR
jgi:hypothetical protein